MSEHVAKIVWERGDASFTDDDYSRAHRWEFDGGAVVAASPSPDIVPLPHSVPENVDPEEAFVAAISSCHMLTFLAIAAKRGFLIDSYVDNAVGHMGKNGEGRMAILEVNLKPDIKYSGDKIPTREQLEKLHHRAHEICFIANSVRTVITTQIDD